MITHRTHRTRIAELLLCAIAIVAAVGLMLSPLMARAADVSASLEWTAPTTRVDGSALPASELESYRVYSAVGGEINADADSAHIAVRDGTSQVVALDLPPRAEPYTVSFAVRAVDTEGRISALSNVVTETFAVESSAEPSPPTGVRFEITCGGGCSIKKL